MPTLKAGGRRIVLRRWASWSAGVLAALMLTACSTPAGSGRNTPSLASPYEAGVYPPGRSVPAGSVPAGNAYPTGAYGTAPAYASLPAGHAAGTPPPPSSSISAQYADWLFDGPEGRGFAYYLADGYRRYAKHEDNANDFEDAAKFIARASAVDRGERVEPETLGMRTLPAYAVDDLLYARQRLMAALNRGAAQHLPKIAANAQVAFDCWMEQQEENLQPHDVAKCRRDFEAFIVRLEATMFTKQPAEPVRQAEPACPASPAPICDAQPTSIYFDLGRHELAPSGRDTVLRLAEQARHQGGKTPLVVTAHTDRAGSDASNVALSKRRLDTVIEALATAGISRDLLVRAEHYGESMPRVPTADGVKLQENRRVELHFACGQSTVESACSLPAKR